MKKSDLDFVNSVAKIKNRVAVKDYYFEDLPKALRKLAFSVANLETIAQINIVKRSLENAQREGLNFSEWKSRIDTQAIKNLGSNHLENVYRTNISSVYNNSTKYNAATSNVTPYLMFVSTNDGRTTPSHDALNGVVKRADSSFWNKFTPPLWYFCRCRVISLSKADAERIGISRKSESSFDDTNMFPSKGSMTDINSGVETEAENALNSLPLNSPYRRKFAEAQENVDSLVDVWWESNKNKFI